MCPPAAAPLANINDNCTDEELINHLEKFSNGSPLPRNVITTINPYCHRPENLSDEFWYLTRSEESKGIEDGVWKPKGEPCRVFSSTSMSGWRTNLEFFEGKVHSQKKTHWVMQEFKIIPNNELGQSIQDPNINENRMLCRVFRSGEDLTDQDSGLKTDCLDASCEKSLCPITLGLIHTDSRFEKGSTSNHQEEDESKKDLPGSPPKGDVAENHPEDDWILRGDYLELWDLQNPGSPSSSSDDSSCMTMTSDECFDYLALLQDLESKEGLNSENRDTNSIPSTAVSERPDRIITQTAGSGSLIINEPRNLPDQGTHMADLPSASTSGTGKEKKRECSPENPSTSRQSSDSEGSKKGSGRTKRLKKKKYLCFLSFQFFL